MDGDIEIYDFLQINGWWEAKGVFLRQEPESVSVSDLVCSLKGPANF